MYCYTYKDNNESKKIYSPYPLGKFSPEGIAKTMPKEVINFEASYCNPSETYIRFKYDKEIPNTKALKKVSDDIYTNIRMGLKESYFDEDIKEALSDTISSLYEYIYYKRTHDNEGNLLPEYINTEAHVGSIEVTEVSMDKGFNFLN